MIGKPGNRIIVESQRVGQLEREGEILEVTQTSVSVRYRVRWSDGHESTLTPAGGAVRVVPSAGSSRTSTSSSGTSSSGTSSSGTSSSGRAESGRKPKEKARGDDKPAQGRAKQEKGKKDKKSKGSKKS